MKSIELREVYGYKSVEGIGAFDLPSMSVLAGLNGAGKSHLLKAIHDGAIQALVDDEVIETDRIVLYDWTDFAVEQPKEAAAWQVAQRVQKLLGAIRSRLTSDKVSQRLSSLAHRLELEMSEQELLRQDIDSLGLTVDSAKLVAQEREWARKQVMEGLNVNNKETVQAIEALKGRMVVELSEDEISSAAQIVRPSVDPLKLNISDLFLSYRKAFDRNEHLRLKATHEEADVEYLSQEEFKSRYGPPPWEVLNDVLADLGLDFAIEEPPTEAETYNATLLQRGSGVAVEFSDLSSGERVLMALAISLYGWGEPRQKVQLPRLMLLDEVDAPLHPDMTRMFFRVINDLLVDNGVPVVLATHNPSTVALAPDGSIRRMSRAHPRITEVTRQQALSDLTSGVTALTPRFDERRVVLVEGGSDADVYTAVWDALRIHVNVEYGLAFVASGLRAGEGGKEVVRGNVQRLREAGAETIYGLIDWDMKNAPAEDGSVLVLGKGQRYTLENYVFDPLLLSALAVRQKFSQDIEGLDDLLETDVGTWRGLDRANRTTLQRISDHMLSRIARDDDDDSDRITAKLVGNEEITLPRWFVELRGHTLIDRWHEGVQRFREFQDEADLRQAITTFVISDIPNLLSRDFLDVMEALAGDPDLAKW